MSYQQNYLSITLDQYFDSIESCTVIFIQRNYIIMVKELS